MFTFFLLPQPLFDVATPDASDPDATEPESDSEILASIVAIGNVGYVYESIVIKPTSYSSCTEQGTPPSSIVSSAEYSYCNIFGRLYTSLNVLVLLVSKAVLPRVHPLKRTRTPSPLHALYMLQLCLHQAQLWSSSSCLVVSLAPASRPSQF